MKMYEIKRAVKAYLIVLLDNTAPIVYDEELKDCGIDEHIYSLFLKELESQKSNICNKIILSLKDSNTINVKSFKDAIDYGKGK